MKHIAYTYNNLKIPGGGYVTGFLFDPVEKDVMYIRTDIGGTYRFDYKADCFLSLIDHINLMDLSETFPIAIATDKNVPGSLYIACGVGNDKCGEFVVSKDYGKTTTHEALPVPAHGNWSGRGAGRRLIVDDNGNIFFASPRNGLYKTSDEGKTWEKLDVCKEEYCTMVFSLPHSDTIIVGTAGVTNKVNDKKRGHSLYVSYDGGAGFEKMVEPLIDKMPTSAMTGFVAHRYSYDGKYLYITMNNSGSNSFVKENGYSCDSGHVIGGIVLRYSFSENGRVEAFEDISPNRDVLNNMSGYGSVSASMQTPGLLVLSSLTKSPADTVYRSYDYGQTWEPVLEGLRVGKIEFNSPYMKPCYNGGRSLIHWLSDIEMNPHDDNEVWFNTGTGVFRCRNFKDETPVFADCCKGLEETVHLNVYAPTGSDVYLIDILGDLGGFAFRNLDKPCENSFADADGNRYITCMNADYSDKYPECVIVTPRGNWTGETKGGLIKSSDACRTFDRIPLPYGLSERLDRHFEMIERPNVNSGWVAMSPDTRNIVWSVADGISLPKDMVIHSSDGGLTWEFVSFDTFEDALVKVYSDRTNSSLFYGFTEKGNILVSTDGGASFSLRETQGKLDGVNFGRIDCANHTEIRGESGREGVFYMALSRNGLWKMKYDLQSDKVLLSKLSKDGDFVFRIGLGLIKSGADYFTENKALYLCGIIDGEYGFYRSFDDAKTYERINSDMQMYGEINSIDADKRTFGRFYIATGSRGVLYGEEK